MAKLIAGLFTDSKDAGEAVGKLKEMDDTKDVTLVTKDYEEDDVDETTHTIKENISDGATEGAVMGAAVAGLTTLLAGVTAIALPGSILITGPIATALTASAAGAVAGGLVGALVDAGLPEEQANLYQTRVEAGETLVAVTVDDERADDVIDIFNQHGAQEMYVED